MADLPRVRVDEQLVRVERVARRVPRAQKTRRRACCPGRVVGPIGAPGPVSVIHGPGDTRGCELLGAHAGHPDVPRRRLNCDELQRGRLPERCRENVHDDPCRMNRTHGERVGLGRRVVRPSERGHGARRRSVSGGASLRSARCTRRARGRAARGRRVGRCFDEVSRVDAAVHRPDRRRNAPGRLGDGRDVRRAGHEDHERRGGEHAELPEPHELYLSRRRSVRFEVHPARLTQLTCKRLPRNVRFGRKLGERLDDAVLHTA